MEMACRGRVVAIVGATGSEERQGENRPEGWKRACRDSDTFFDHRPESDLPCAEHEFGRIVVEVEVSESDDCCAACTEERDVRLLYLRRARRGGLGLDTYTAPIPRITATEALTLRLI